MSQIVEKVARAMFDSRKLGDSLVAFDGSRFKGTSWRDLEKLARTAIGAMRDPTEDMLDAYPPIAGENPSGLDIWRDMIDAALKE